MVLAAFALAFPVPLDPDEVELARVRAERICEHVRVLASDEFEGRQPGTPGEDRTLAYLEEAFREAGLAPAGPDGSYFQRVELARFTVAPPESLVVRGERGAVELRHGDDVLLGSERLQRRVTVPDSALVFAGFGIHAPEIGWDDWGGLDVRGKVVVVESGTPEHFGDDDVGWRGDPAANLWGQAFAKREEAARRGALGLLVVHRTTERSPWTWDGLRAVFGKDKWALRRPLEEAQLAFHGLLAPAAAERLFELADDGPADPLAEARSREFRARELGLTTRFQFETHWEELDTYNAVAMLPGSTRPDEVLLYTAHWDHVGIGEPVDGDAIRNGAVDNATGVAAMIELGRALAERPRPLKRTALFVATTAEEMGLLGAAWYARHPLFPLERTVAAFNLDAHFPYGRTTHVTGVVYGRSELDGYLEEAARRQGRVLVPNTEQNTAQGIFFRSDHFPLIAAGVPAEFAVGAGSAMGHDNAAWERRMQAYMSKYHQPSDEFEADFDCGGTWQDAELVMLAGELLDRSDAFPRWDEEQPFGRARDGARYETAYFRDVSRTHLPVTSVLGRSMDARPFDADGDGDLDLAIANEHAFNLLLVNDGSGRFTDESTARLPLVRRDSEDVAAADFDGDGDTDLLFVSEDDEVDEYYLNDGAGRFEDASYRLPVSGTTNAVAALDVDGDGHLDLVLGNAPGATGTGQDSCFVNDGAGGWRDETALRLPRSTRATQDLEVGDLDLDGDLDLVVGNEDDCEMWIADGGRFADQTAERLPLVPGAWETREADLGDVDGDGDLDLFLANVNFRQNKDSRNRLFLNEGGVFRDATAELLPAEVEHSVDGDFTDLDGDGDLDLVTSNGFGASFRAYLNRGGVFAAATREVLPASLWGDGIDTEAADFDGDGVADLYCANFRGEDALLLGRPRPSEAGLAELLDRHVEAMGGLEAWTSLRSWRVTQARTDGSVVTTAELPDRFRIDFELGGVSRVKSFDGEEGWVSVDGAVEDMRPGEAVEMAEEPVFPAELVFAVARDLPIHDLGHERVEGVLCRKLRLRKSPTDEQFYWLDPETALVVQVGEVSEDRAHAGIFYRTRLSDWREVEGLLFPFAESLRANDEAPRSWTTERVELDVDLADDAFARPR